jgi:cell division protein FtsB
MFIKNIILLFVIIILIIYISVNIGTTKNSFIKYESINKKYQELNDELLSLNNDIDILIYKTDGLKSKSPNLEVIEEQAKIFLNYFKTDEIVINIKN